MTSIEETKLTGFPTYGSILVQPETPQLSRTEYQFFHQGEAS